jgi:UDP-3-O-[3-hydroxymyristoyl] N-acetylglucosamine deacetylase
MFQKTINKEISFHGIGVHFGLPALIIIYPAEPGTGIVFKNTMFVDEQIKLGEIIPEIAMHASVLKKNKFIISTLEHLMATISAFQLDNLLIEIQGIEVPILDGSALNFVEAIRKVGIKDQDKVKLYLTPIEQVSFKDEKNDRVLDIYPAGCDNSLYDTTLYFEYLADFMHPLVGKSSLAGIMSTQYFINEIAPARTFGFLEQLPYLKSKGLAKGTSLGNTVVIGEDDYLNTPRFQDEFVRHKLLDLIGDLALLGKNIAGKVVAKKTGHSLNRLVVQDYINNPNNWKLIS